MTSAHRVWGAAAIVQAIGIAALAAWLAARAAPAAVTGAGEPSNAVPTAEPADAAAAPRTDAAPALPREGAPPGSPARSAETALPDIGAVLHVAVRVRNGSLPDAAFLALSQGTEQVALGAVHAQRMRHAIAGLPAGDYRLTAEGQGIAAFERTLTIPPGVPVVRVDIELEPSWMVKVVLQTPDGQPLHEALGGAAKLRDRFGGAVNVIAWWRELPARLPLSHQRETPITVAEWTSRAFRTKSTDALPSHCAGVLELRELRDAVVAAVFRDVVLAQQPITAGQGEVTLTVDPGQLYRNLAGVRLQVVDAATGEPVAGAAVEIDEPGSWTPPSSADDEGRFEQLELRPGRHELTITSGRHCVPVLQVDLPPGITTDLGAIAAVAPVDLHLHVPELADVQRAGLSLDPLDAPRGSVTPQPFTCELRKGHAEAKVPPGRYRLRVAHKSRGARLEVDTRGREGETIVVTLSDEPALRIDPSSLDERVRCEIATGPGESVFDRWLRPGNPFDLRLPAGDYRVRIERLGEPVREQRLTLPPEGTKLVLR